MRSSTPWRLPSGLRGSTTSSQFLKAARPSSPQNFERALRLRKSARVSVKPRARQSAARRLRYCVDVKAERHRQLLLLDRGDVEVCGRCDPTLGQLDQIVDRRHPARAEDFSGHELGRPDRRRELLEQRLAFGIEAKEEIGHEHRYQPRQSPAEIGVHTFEVAIGLPQRIGRFDQGRTELFAEHRFDLGRGSGGDRRRRLGSGRHQHRLADDPDAHAGERPRGAGHPGVARIRGPPAPRSAAPSYRVARVVIAGSGSFSASSTLAQSTIVRQRMPLRSQ